MVNIRPFTAVAKPLRGNVMNNCGSRIYFSLTRKGWLRGIKGLTPTSNHPRYNISNCSHITMFLYNNIRILITKDIRRSKFPYVHECIVNAFNIKRFKMSTNVFNHETFPIHVLI